jgi:hypothetical protein
MGERRECSLGPILCPFSTFQVLPNTTLLMFLELPFAQPPNILQVVDIELVGKSGEYPQKCFDQNYYEIPAVA